VHARLATGRLHRGGKPAQAVDVTGEPRVERPRTAEEAAAAQLQVERRAAGGGLGQRPGQRLHHRHVPEEGERHVPLVHARRPQPGGGAGQVVEGVRGWP
jgi:hypothetical protein